MRQPVMYYVALLRTPGGLIQRATIYAESLTHAHHTIRELWPGLQLVRIAKEDGRSQRESHESQAQDG